jgi:competence protein ComEC
MNPKAAPGRPIAAGLTLAAGMLAWLAGVALQLQQRELPAPAALALLAGLAVVALAAAVLARRRRRAALTLALLLPGLVALGFGWATLLAQQRLQQALPAMLDGADVELVGVVASMPRVLAGGLRFDFHVESAQWRGAPLQVPAQVPQRVSVGWFGGVHDGLLMAGAPVVVEAGQRWRLTVRLRTPHGARNPHGFDLELWLFERGLRAVGTVRSAAGQPAPRLLAQGVAHPVERARQRVRDALFERVADPGAAGVLAGLAVGDQASIERDDWRVFRDTGTAHLMAISGLHVTMFAWLAGALIGAAWRCSARLMLGLPAPLAARWGGVAVAAAYAVFAGWGVPAQRTVWMLAAAALILSLGWRWPWLLVLLAAAVVVSVADPWALLQPGFWLSFVAVGLLLASEPAGARAGVAAAGAVAGWRARAWAPLREALRTQVIASVGLAPLTLLLFQQVSLVGLLANLVAVPLVTLVITPLALLGMLAPPLWDLGAWLVAELTQVLTWLAGRPAAVWHAAVAPPWAQAAALLAAALAVMPLPWRLRLLAVPLALPLLWPAPERLPPGRFELLAADVGQGTAVLLRTRDHVLLYDTGPRYWRSGDAGERVLVPLLRALGVRRIDVLMLSHGDADHAGGAASVLAALPVQRSYSSLPDGHALRAPPLPHRRCDAGMAWQWDGVRFEVLHPLAEDHARPLRPNALSCVLRVVDAHGRAALLAGDIGVAQEAALVARLGAGLRSEVLLVPHHGGRGSSSPGFVDAVAPRVALVQAGRGNRHGHPAAEVVARYEASGAALLRSERCGAWRWRSDGEGHCQRAVARRYWHAR